MTGWWANSVGTEYWLASKLTSDSESTHRGSTRAATNASRRQRQEGRPLLVEPLGLGRRLAPEPPRQVLAAPPLEVGVERLQPAVDDRDRHEEVAAGEADQRLDVPLLVGPPHQAEVGLEQVMTLEPEERVGDLAVAAAE